MTPLEILSGTFSVINGAIVFGQFVLKLSDVDGDTRTCIALLQRVNRDIDEAETLRKLKYPTKGPKCRQHLRALEAIRDTRNAAFEVGKLVCVPKNGSLGFKNRLQWVMSDKESFVTREKTLHYSHVALLQVITTMESRPRIMSPGDSSDSRPPPYDEVVTDHQPTLTSKVISIPSGEGFRLPNGPLAPQRGHSGAPEWETPSQKYLGRQDSLHTSTISGPIVVPRQRSDTSHSSLNPSSRNSSYLSTSSRATASFSSILDPNDGLDDRLISRRGYTSSQLLLRRD